MNQNVSNKIKTFNYIFTLFILIYHLRFLDGYNIIYRNNFDKSILDFFMSITTHFDDLALTAFFIISSFLFYYNIDSSNQAIIKIKKRLKTLFIPYCI